MLTMRGGSQANNNNGVKMTRPPPVPPRPDKSVVADALAKSRKVPAPVLPPGLKKELALKNNHEPPQTQNDTKVSNNKIPSPKLNGLSRVKSFIRDVMNDKRHSDDKKSKDENDKNDKNKSKSQIPVPQTQTLPKQKTVDPVCINITQDEPSKSQSNQSVVRSLCGLVNSEKDKPNEIDTKAERVRVVKSNSFAEKAVPVRKAPPPPISPKPSRKQIEEKLARNSNKGEGFSIRKLSVSCEELNNTPRPVIFQSICKKIGSPLFVKKSVPPSLPSGKPPVLAKKKALTCSPTGRGCNGFNFPERSMSIENLNGSERNSNIDKSRSSLKIDDKDDFSQKLISEIISARNDTLLLNYQNGEHSTNDESSHDPPVIRNIRPTDDSTKAKNTVISCNYDRVQCVNVPYEKNTSKGHSDNNSVCGSDSSGSGTGKTILFINSDTRTHLPTTANQEDSSNTPNTGIVDSVANNSDNKLSRFNDIANHELLIAELQHMRQKVTESKVEAPSQPPSPDSITEETQNIQRSNWEHVDDNGKKIRYSSCQIVIEDQSPVDDSGICLDDNFSTNCDDSYCLSPSLLSRLKEQYYANLKMSTLQGLPPLPKSLSGFNVSENSPQANDQPQQHPQPPPVPARSAASFRYGARAGSASPPAVNGTPETQRTNRKPTTLDTQLALLKREMLSLRQLDLSLLSQLWSLNESIHEFRQYINAGGGPGGMGGMGGNGGSGLGPDGDGDMEDDGDDSSSEGEDSRHSPPRL